VTAGSSSTPQQNLKSIAMQSLRQPPLAGKTRRGLTTPVVAIALVLAMAGLALILDRLWLEAAQLELTTAAEAVALATARQVASDDLLRQDITDSERLGAARQTAQEISSANRIAGEPPVFDSEGDDLQFGNYITDEAGTTFEPDNAQPSITRVTLHRSRARNNPVALFIGELTGVPFGDVVRQADACVDNQISAVRPVGDAPVPALPLAIWKVDPTGERRDTWQVQIDQRRGKDDYAYDTESHAVIRGSDGIPEITVISLARNGRPETCNLQLVDVGTNFDEEKLRQQIQSGWTAENLESFGGQFSAAGGITLNSTAQLLNSERDELEQILGQPRICLLFSQSTPGTEVPFTVTKCVELIAVRVMSVTDQPDGACAIVLQPTVLATRSAVTGAGSTTQLANKYIYNLQLTN